uniref:SSD domain-containing protein n=1 Tax=Haemonchus contortus TaxID=6289 RepID=A0A7I4Y6A8_HAECO
MLTLLEPPGAKRVQALSNRSAQHLLRLNPEDEEYFDATDYDSPNEVVSSRNAFKRFLDKYLVWKSSSDDYNDRWKREFLKQPSWCDADLCLQQIKRGKASGNQWALYMRSFIQKTLFSLGNFVHANSATVIFTVLMLFSICCYGLQFVHIETDIVKLWVAKGGRLDEELNFLSRIKSTMNSNDSNGGSEIARENGLGGGYQVIIQTPEYAGQNILDRDPLLKHVDTMREIANFSIELHNVSWSLSDICFKPSPPELDGLAAEMSDVIERIVPCIWITPIDCFWEGAKALGPHPPIETKDLALLAWLKSIPNRKYIQWTDFDPMAVIDEIHEMLNLGSHHTFFERAGVGHGYLDRPCMNPLDPECPKMSPNYYDVCPMLDRFRSYAEKNNITLEADDFSHDVYEFDFLSLFNMGSRRRRKRDIDTLDALRSNDTEVTESPITTSKPELNPTDAVAESAANEEAQRKEKAMKAAAEECKAYRGPMMRWMFDNPDKWSEFLVMSEYPRFPDYAQVMSGGCPGFAAGVLHWPEDMILGGVKRSAKGAAMESADALQSVFLVASPNDVYLRYKQKGNRPSAKPELDQLIWSEKFAEEVIQQWQRNFTQMLYKHRANFDEEGFERRTIHPLASTSIADMLEEFCQFNYKIILVGYGLMLVYAVFTQMKRDGCLPSSQSCMGLALAGVLTVTYASISGLGLATWFGIEFNAATTQIVPFLTLGIGVDNMFMLLHNYHDVMSLTNQHEIGILMRETGMSILCTSINNILSFLAGTMLPIPALRSFCAQSSILLTFNFIAILTLYPAIISIDLRRRKAGMRDVFCCLVGETRQEAYSMITKPHFQEKRTIGEPIPRIISYKDVEEEPEPESLSLHSLIRNYYIPFINRKCVKIGVLGGSFALLVLAVSGMQRAAIGLELSDVLPEHTAPAKFLQARDKYFSFYPMFAVIKGPNIDYAVQQQRIDKYRRAIASSKFVIKTKSGEPSEKYWLGMMRDWLASIQKAYDDELALGKFNLTDGELKGNVSEDAEIAHRLICSVGRKYQCEGRVGKVRLVDGTQTINNDGFYNYLTAWYNQDNMMYYVSQASFYPTPPKWSITDKKAPLLVPPAEPLAYSQIPFYLTGLTDTPVIIEMIKEIRSTCDRFVEEGLPNFPQGIAFTFWEQYLHLNGNLLTAIGVIAFAVFIVISILLFNPWAALNILIILVVMTVELAGFMGWAGVKMNPVSAVTLITAVGIGVEFTAHVVLAYLTSLGTRSERTSSAIDRVFVPVIHGALSTLLGILMLGFSEFEFVVKYFFVVMSALIVIGVINGLILLPVLLSLMGAPQEVFSMDGKARLNLPPPIRRRETEIEEDDEGLMMVSRGGRAFRNIAI